MSDVSVGGSSPIVAAYFPEWGIYSRDYNISDVPADQLTHLIYAFTKIDASGKIALFDSFAATDKAFSAADSVDGVADSWTDGSLRGNFNQIAELKAANPGLKASIAVGGWTLSGNFSSMASTQESRKVFIDSVIEFLKTYTMFDGVDLDWEYPGGGGLGSNQVSANDGQNYALLAQELRTALDTLGGETGRYYEISVAAPAGYDKIANFNLEGLHPHVDFINMMAYDFYGAWQNTTGHQAGVFDPSGGRYDIATATQLYLDAGVPPEKIVLGTPMYTRAWQGVNATGPENAWNAPATGKAPGSFEAGIYDYKDILAFLQDPNSGWKLYYDDNAQAAFVWNEALKIFSSIETPETVSLKSEWAQSQGFGGIMYWDLSNDAVGSSESLLKAGSDSWLKGMEFSEIANASQLEFEAVFGGDGVVAPIAEADTPAVPPVAPPPVTTPPAADDPTPPVTPPPPADDTAPPADGTPPPADDVPPPTPPSASPPQDLGLGTAGVTAQTATVAINWAYNSNTVVQFDASKDTVFVSWLSADHIEVSETAAGVVISVPSNQQTTTLSGVKLSDLSASNFTFLDASAAQEVLSLVGQSAAPPAGDVTPPPAVDVTPPPADDVSPPPAGPPAGDGTNTSAVSVSWNWANVETVIGFDASSGVIDLGNVGASQLQVSAASDGDVILEIVGNGGQQYRFDGVTADDLSANNFTAADWNTAAIGSVLDDLSSL